GKIEVTVLPTTMNSNEEAQELDPNQEKELTLKSTVINACLDELVTMRMKKWRKDKKLLKSRSMMTHTVQEGKKKWSRSSP
ncbi:36090_t:CDS:2, partial [Racocetra persica]